jgi:transposase
MIQGMNDMPDLTRLSHADKDELICRLWPLQFELAKLMARVTELEIRLAKNSRNSSKPPGTDGLAKPAPKSSRVVSGLKPGGQPGHKGQTLKRTTTPDAVVIHPVPETCDACGAFLDQIAITVLSDCRQVFDIPLQTFIVTEHRIAEGCCGCGKVHRGTFPSSVIGRAQYGPGVKALAVHLTQHHMMPVERTAGLINDLYRLPISTGTVMAMINEAAEVLAPTVACIADGITQSVAAGADETGMRVAGKLHWLHTLATTMSTWMGVHPRRGREAIEEFALIPRFAGILGHDGWMPYRHYSTCQHALCNAHHVRELRAIAEAGNDAWPQQMIDMLYRANVEVDAAVERRLPQKRIVALRTKYRSILTAGELLNPPAPCSGQRGRTRQSEATNLLARLREYENDVLRFTFNSDAPFTNNIAEQAIRMCKVKQKVSGCFRTLAGAAAFCTIRSYLATLHKQNFNLYHSLVQALQGNVPQPRFG